MWCKLDTYRMYSNIQVKTLTIFFPSAIEQSWWQLKFLLKNTLFSQVYEKRHSSISRHYNSSSCHFFPKCHCHCQQMKGPGEKNYALPVIKACLTITVLSTYVLMLFKTGWKRRCAIPPYLELINAANICRWCFDIGVQWGKGLDKD